MDPLIILQQARTLAARIIADVDSMSHDEAAHAAESLAEKFEALDVWMSGRGFSPWGM